MSDIIPDRSKAAARERVYEALHKQKAGRFPFPIEGRIPNFVGAERAAQLLATLSVYKRASAVKVNPDAPQLPVRTMILKDGKDLYMPTPRLRDGFCTFHPGEFQKAKSAERPVCPIAKNTVSRSHWSKLPKASQGTT